jgi:hypothetical protein
MVRMAANRMKKTEGFRQEGKNLGWSVRVEAHLAKSRVSFLRGSWQNRDVSRVP